MEECPVIAGTGSNNTRESIELTRLAEDVGVDGDYARRSIL